MADVPVVEPTADDDVIAADLAGLHEAYRQFQAADTEAEINVTACNVTSCVADLLAHGPLVPASRLAEVTAERDESREALQIVGLLLATARRERDEARAALAERDTTISRMQKRIDELIGCVSTTDLQKINARAALSPSPDSKEQA